LIEPFIFIITAVITVTVQALLAMPMLAPLLFAVVTTHYYCFIFQNLLGHCCHRLRCFQMLMPPLLLLLPAVTTSQLIVNFQYCPCCHRLRCCWCLLSVQLARCMTTVVVNVVQATAVSTAVNPTISTAISPTFSTAIDPAGWLLPAGWSLLLYKKILLAVVILSPLAFKILLVVAVIVINDTT